MKKDPRVDAYIEKAADFAKPILRHVRKVVHEAAPQIEETLKWSMPSFVYKGIVCGMAAFKQHCSFGFWHEDLIRKNLGLPTLAEQAGMGNHGKLTSVKDLPSDAEIKACLREAIRLNEAGVKKPAAPKNAARKITVPADLKAALRKNSKALNTFENFSPSHKREYVEWITGAKRPETRTKRLDTAIAWMAQGKPHNWRYM